jgi:uncharacterized membrane protein YgcG
MIMMPTLTKKQKLIAAGILAAALVLTAILVLACCWIFTPDPKTANQKDIADYMASNAFGRLNADEKKAYMDKLRERKDLKPPEGLSRDQMDKIRRNMGDVMREQMKKDMEEWSKLPASEQIAFLDKKIDEMQKMGPPGSPPPGAASQPSGQSDGKQQAGGPPPGGGPGGPGGPGGGGPPGSGGAAGRARMSSMLANSNPRERALRGAFMTAMRKRMQERGISMPGPGGPGGGPGGGGGGPR